MRYYSKFVDFLVEHGLYEEEAFDYIWSRITFFDYRDVDMRRYINCFYFVDSDKKLLDFNVIVPILDSDIAVAINIHEYVHAMEAYKNIGKVFTISDDVEVLPMLYEKIFVLENDTVELTEYKRELDKERVLCKDSDNGSYINGDILQKPLLKLYDIGFKYRDLKVVSKVLTKKRVKRIFFNK